MHENGRVCKFMDTSGTILMINRTVLFEIPIINYNVANVCSFIFRCLCFFLLSRSLLSLEQYVLSVLVASKNNWFFRQVVGPSNEKKNKQPTNQPTKQTKDTMK